MSRNACIWCGTEVEDDRQYELAICGECYADAAHASQAEVRIEEMRDNGDI